MELPKITLNKDQQQKIILSFLLLCFVIYGYFSFLLNPLQLSAERSVGEAATLEKKIDDANKRLKAIGDLKAKAAAASGLIVQAQAFIPDGAPIAWYPPRLRSFFARHGFPSITVTARGTESAMDREFEKKFSLSNWNIAVPSAEFVPFCIALAGLENEEVLSEIMQITISTRDAELVQVSLDMQSILKQNP